MNRRALGFSLPLLFVWIVACEVSPPVPTVAPTLKPDDRIATGVAEERTRIVEKTAIAATLTADASKVKQTPLPTVTPKPTSTQTQTPTLTPVPSTPTPADASTTKQIQTLTPVRLTAPPTFSTAAGQVEGKLPEAPGVRITLCDNVTLGNPGLGVPINCNGEFERSATADSSGYFLIPEVPPGRYFILFDIPATLQATLPPGSLFGTDRSGYDGTNTWSSGGYTCIRLALREVCFKNFDATTKKFFSPPIEVVAGKTTYYSKMR